MSDLQQEKVEKLEQLHSLIQQRIAGKAGRQVERFADLFFANVPPEDFEGWGAQDMYGALLSQWNLLKQRRPGAPAVTIYNPDYEEHSWESTHTIVEIVQDDMPFLVDSMSLVFANHALGIHLIIHPVIAVRRGAKGQLLEVADAFAEEAEGFARESIMHFELDRQTDLKALETLRRDIERVLGEVRSVVEDWQRMRARMEEAIAEIDASKLPLSRESVEEDQAFLRWLTEDHFTFLGYRAYRLVRGKDGDELESLPDSGLGILRDRASVASRSFSQLPPELQKQAREPTLLILTKSNTRSSVHRAVNMDYVGIKRFDKKGRVTGEHRFLGLYTSAAYSQSPRSIPLLRQKFDRVMKRAKFPPASHDGKALAHILESLPRDELLQMREDELFETCMGILHLQERQRVRLFLRRDPFDRFVSCLVYVPRDSYNTELRMRMCAILMKAFNGTDIDFTVQLSEQPLARVHFIVRTEPGSIPRYDARDVEMALVKATRSWQDDLLQSLLEHCGEERGNTLFQKYRHAFPAGYVEQFTPRTAVYDIEHMERLVDENALEMLLYRPPEAPAGALRFKLFRHGEPLFLSGTLPMLENMGVEVTFEHPYKIQAANSDVVWIHNFGLQHSPELQFATEAIKGIFQEAFERVWNGEMENDSFNRLVLAARLDWREVVLLRAYTRYLRQINASFSDTYIAATLEGNAAITRDLVELFHCRFDPRRHGAAADEQADSLAEKIVAQIDSVSSLDEDRILRRFLAAIEGTLRTNFYQMDEQGAVKSYLSFKFDPATIPDMPDPKPAYEIFVYSPRTEGVHLRGGKVARGGLRWSDRREDFRTEILGLVKSQLVKNAVIVPVGAKGGFIMKQPPASGNRDEIEEEVKACYRTFIRGLLDITDNLRGGAVVPPRDVVRRDDDDPYLVVAADKGTATFSDIANELAAEYGFWLGDAFASGGSVGYDHKKLGITARGAWESVKRHFYEAGIRWQEEPFTVVGIGDMAGDVFGNGMLYSPNIRLIAAFNHLHIFLDPDPDPAVSFAERERLFKLPHSTWEDYNRELLSPGGGVYSRRAKSIALSPEIRERLQIREQRLTPNELIQAILRAPVDLMWSGGIGTFVKASDESHLAVGDRANDAIRIDGCELRCRVVGEGGNLGLTQLGRIEYARNGGRINTDFVDNSGGVDCSDHEVNIKILLDGIVANGDMTIKQRNQLLAKMADEVCQHVIEHNRRRAQALSIVETLGTKLLDEQQRFMRAFERDGLLNRALEFLPGDEELAERRNEGIGLFRPELSVLMAYSAIVLYQQLLESDIADDPYFAKELQHYFPVPLRKRFSKEMESHRLRREIITTQVTNSMVNRVGITFVHRLREETGAAPSDIARCYATVREVFDLRDLWQGIESQQERTEARQQLALFVETGELVERATVWFLRRQKQPLSVSEAVERFRPGVRGLAQVLPGSLVDSDREMLESRIQRVAGFGIDETLARRIASLRLLYSALDFVEVESRTRYPIQDIAYVYFHLGDRLGLHWLRDQIAAISVDNHWQAMARDALRDDLYSQQSELVAGILSTGKRSKKIEPLIERWLTDYEAATLRWRSVQADLRATGTLDLAMLSVAVREVRDLVRTTVKV
ncbi:MAG: NAD-glutamate dehydrogenase [Gammaproteobacteria bacterium]